MLVESRVSTAPVTAKLSIRSWRSQRARARFRAAVAEAASSGDDDEICSRCRLPLDDCRCD